jgi:hypothetical protein
MKKMYLLLTLTIALVGAQDPADLVQSEAIQETQQSIEQNEVEESIQSPVEVLTEMMDEKLDKKATLLGDVNDDGSIYMIGAATTIFSMNQPGFIRSRVTAFQKAELQAKINILRLAGETITSERGMETLDQFTEGTDPDMTKKASLLQKAMGLEDKSMDQALLALGSTEEEIAALNSEQKEVLYKEDFYSKTTSLVANMLSGCAVVKTLEGDVGKDDYQIAVCVKYSPEFRRLSAIIDQNIEYELDPGKAKDSFSKFKDMDEEKLVLNLGAKVMFNEIGQRVIFGFGQIEFRGGSRRLSSKIQTAENKARLEAATAIKNFVAEDLVGEETSENVEKYREYADSTEGAYQFEKWEQKIKAKSSTLNLSTKIVRKWRGKHPLSGHDVVGVVVAWSPDTANRGRHLKQVLEEDVNLKSSKQSEKKKREQTKKTKYLGDDDDDDDL